MNKHERSKIEKIVETIMLPRQLRYAEAGARRIHLESFSISSKLVRALIEAHELELKFSQYITRKKKLEESPEYQIILQRKLDKIEAKKQEREQKARIKKIREEALRKEKQRLREEKREEEMDMKPISLDAIKNLSEYFSGDSL